MKNFKNIKLMLLGVLVAFGSVNAFAAELATTVWRYTTSGNDATLVGFVAEYPNSDKASVVIPNQVTDPLNASKKYNVVALEDGLFTTAEKGLIKSISFEATKITAINDVVFAGLGNLTTFDLTKATGLTTIADGAFKGTKIEALDLSKTKVTTVGNLFGTNFEYVATGGTYTKEEANDANVDWLKKNKKPYVSVGDPIMSTGTFTTYDQINSYYKTIYGDDIRQAGDLKPMDKAEANTANKGKFPGCVAATDPVKWTLETALAWNVANVKGAMGEGYVLDEVTAGVYNTALGITTKKDGDVLTANEAQAYNEKLASGTVTYKKTLSGTFYLTDKVAIVGNNAFDENGDQLLYTDDTAYAYNLANQPGCFVVGDEGTTPLSTHYEAWCWNNDNVVPADGVKGLGESGTVPSGSFYDLNGAYDANWASVPPANRTTVGDSKAGTKVPAINNNTFTSLTMNNIWTAILPGAFENCTALATLSLGTATDDVSSQAIGDRAFLGSALTEVNLVGTKVAGLFSDTFVDYDKSYTDKANSNATIASVTFNKLLTAVPAGLFGNCTALATVVFEDRDIKTESAPGQPVVFETECNFTGIGAYAFASTAIESIEIPQALNAALISNVGAVQAGAFYNCQKLKSFTYMVDNETSGVYAVVDDLAFPGCIDVAYVTTNANISAYMAAETPAPKNTHFVMTGGDGYVTPFVTTEFAKQPGKYYIKYVAAADIRVDKNEAKVYDAYRDDTDFSLNMTLYKASGSYYNITKGSTVLIITNNKNLTYETKSPLTSGSFNGSNNVLQIVDAKDGFPRATLDFAAGMIDHSCVVYGWVNSTKAGTGFQHITSGETFPQGTLYALAAESADGARPNIIWRDENGNIDSDPTAIDDITTIESESNDAIFNLQGVRSNAAQKGVYIKAGKKFVK